MHDAQVGNDHPRTGSGPIRLILADDHIVMRQGLRALFDLHEEFRVIGEADSADAAVSAALELRPDLVLMDLRMPGSGIEATRQITQAASDVRVLILTTYDNVNRAGFDAASVFVKDADHAQALPARAT
ncbi:response regulator transcription factor [Rhodococcus qingshengii]|uniref:response regulator n=1 Tax=Rhodococcus qingshengii TaxID=334542 RepID=UPI0036DDE933